MSRTRAIDYEQQRTKILSKAVEAFAQRGYASAGMLELARQCELSKATLYHYYPTKEAMLFDALNRYTLRLQELAQSTEDNNRTVEPAQALRALLRAFMQEYRQSSQVHLVLLNGPQFLAPEQRQIINLQERAVANAFGRALHRCFPQQVNGRNEFALSMTLLSALNFSFAWLRDNGSLSHQLYADWIADLWLKGVPNSEFVVPPNYVTPNNSTRTDNPDREP
jgi:AcrR family transcriptional regulator